LGLELGDPGFDYTLLHEFRTRLLENEAEQLLLEALLELLKARKLLKARGKQRTDSTHVLDAVRDLNRLELVGETMRHALNSLAGVVPAWLRDQVPSEWFDRYSKPFSQWRLPRQEAERDALAEVIGQDGYQLWQMTTQSPDREWLCEIPAVQTLRQVWLQRYYVDEGRVHWRKKGNLPPAERRIISPYDTEARYSTRRSTKWCGYKVHLTETCEEDQPLLITNVETTPSTTQDVSVTETIHEHLDEKGLLPRQHLVDAGYVDARGLAESQSEYGIDLFGPPRPDSSWQAKAGQGFDSSCFAIDWEQQAVTCPQGCISVGWFPHQDRCGEPRILVKFAKSDCLNCPTRAQCVRSQSRGRTLAFRPKQQHLALQNARRRQQTDEFKQAYARRAGVEGTISQGTRRSDLRRSRYIGLAKTHLQHVFTAVAINLIRLSDWFEDTERARTRCSRFAALATAA
jgi:transposase